jgi:GTPase Era involved in 16S rRNA processing
MSSTRAEETRGPTFPAVRRRRVELREIACELAGVVPGTADLAVRVLVIGDVARGKSTLVSALAGPDALSGHGVEFIEARSLASPSDVVLFVLDAFRGLSVGEAAMLREFEHGAARNTFVVFNRINQIDTDDLDEVCEMLTAGVGENGADKSRVFFVDAGAGLRAVESGDAAADDGSGIAGLRRALMDVVESHHRATAQRLLDRVAALPSSPRLEIIAARLAVCASATGSAEYADALLQATKVAVAEHVRFAEQAARDCGLDDTAELDAALARVHARLADNDFRLALVGEFSSGKSTFINALLDEPPLFPEKWLKTSALATTGAETEVCHGDLRLEARIAGSPNPVEFTGADSPLAREVGRHLDGERPPGDVTGMLRVLTTDARLAGIVESVRLTHPDPLLGEHVVLIDTPGINANERYAHHADVTRRAVQRADTALVFIPADKPLSITLTRFLEDELGPYLPRCVFLVSRLGRVDPEHRAEILEWVREEVQQRFGLVDPPVLGAALNVAEAYARDPTSVADADLHWVEDFAALERTLHERLGRERAHVVSESALRVVEQLVRGLHEHLSQEHTALKAAQQELEATAVRAVDDVAREVAKECDRHLDDAVKRALTNLEPVFNRERHALKRAIRAKLAAADRNQLKLVAATQVEPLARATDDAIRAALERTAASLTGAAEAGAADVASRFADEYHRLGPRADVARTAIRDIERLDAAVTLPRALDTYALRWLVHKPDSPVSYDLEDYGTLAINAVRHWFKTTDEVRNELLTAILSPIDGAFKRLSEGCAEQITAWQARERERARADIDARASAYRHVVTVLRAEQARERQRLRALADETQAAIDEADRRLLELTEQLDRLSTC